MSSTEPEITAAELADSLNRIDRAAASLDEVLSVLFDTFAERGVKPSVHLRQGQEKLHAAIAGAQAGGQRTLTQNYQLRQLVRTSALITDSLDLNEVLDEIMDTVIDLTRAERGYLMLGSSMVELTVRAARNWEKETLTEANVGFSRSIISMALEARKAIVTTNAQSDSRFGASESVVLQQLRSIICIPLLMRGRTVGILYADNRYQKAVFDQISVPMLTAFGVQAAIAIANAQAFEQVKEDLAEAHRVIQELQIQVDQRRVETQVDEIVNTDYFQNLTAMARVQRQRFHREKDPEEASSTE